MALSKVYNERNSYVSWGGIINIGDEPSDENEKLKFSCGKGLVYRIGYCCKRIVKTDDSVESIIIECKVVKANLSGCPLFQCSYKSNTNAEIITVSAKTPTEVTNKVLKKICKNCKHNWSGNEFFGFRRNDVLTAISTRNMGKVVVKFNWFGIKSYGIPIISDPRYLYSTGACHFRLQPGFESVRQVVLNEVTEYIIHCKILQSESGPLFMCHTADKKHSFESIKPTIAMNGVLKALGILKTRNRSGYEFFGFNRADVLNVIKGDITSYSDPILNERYASTNETCLKKLEDIRVRNAGPTSHLLHKKSKIARNGTIHDIVKFASFGDVGSKYIYIYNINRLFYLTHFWLYSLSLSLCLLY